VWSIAYAASATTPEEANDALDAMPSFAPMLAPIARSSVEDLALGSVYLLADRVPDALPILERFNANCDAARYPIENTQGHFMLGEAYERKSDAAAACRAYVVVDDRWGLAKPRSVTAEKARARIAALHCSR
jgi:serine/threonine-protein kinase